MQHQAPNIHTEILPFDGGRKVTVVVPSCPPAGVFYAADGATTARWGELMHGTDIPPTMIIAVHSTADPDEMARLEEYSPGFSPARFAANEAFIINEVRE